MFQSIKRPLYCDGHDKLHQLFKLPDDYSITALQESFPYYAKNGQKSQCFTIYIVNTNNDRQNIASFISPAKRIIKSIDRCLRIREHQILEFVFCINFPKLKTSVFRIAGHRFIRWIRVIWSLSMLLRPEL